MCGSTLGTVNSYGHLIIPKMLIAVQGPNKPDSRCPGHIHKEGHSQCSGGAYGPGNAGSRSIIRHRLIFINSLPFELSKNLREYKNLILSQMNKLNIFICKKECVLC